MLLCSGYELCMVEASKVAQWSRVDSILNWSRVGVFVDSMEVGVWCILDQLVGTFNGWLANRDLNIKSVRSATRNCITMLNAFRDFFFDLFGIFIWARESTTRWCSSRGVKWTSLHSCRKNKSNPQWLSKHKNSFHHQSTTLRISQHIPSSCMIRGWENENKLDLTLARSFL